MRNKNNRLFFLFSAGMLILLYFMSSTNLIIRERKSEIYPISVIVQDSSDEDYEKLRKGMDRAAEELHVDLNFITLFKANDQEQQTALISREINDGARAVILSPAKPKEAALSLEEMMLNSPLIILGSLVPNPQVKAGISIDYQEAGRKLGEAAKANSLQIPVYLLTEGLEYGYAEEIYTGLCRELHPAGYRTILCPLHTKEDCRALIEQTIYPQKQEAVFIALDENSLETAAQIIEDSSVYQESVYALYGIGGSTRILNYLDKGVIQGLIVHNWFDEGYLSIEKAVEAIQTGSGEKEEIFMDVCYITKEELRDPAYEKMLYPID